MSLSSRLGKVGCRSPCMETPAIANATSVYHAASSLTLHGSSMLAQSQGQSYISFPVTIFLSTCTSPPLHYNSSMTIRPARPEMMMRYPSSETEGEVPPFPVPHADYYFDDGNLVILVGSD